MKSEERTYNRTRFPAEVVRKAITAFDQQVNPSSDLKPHIKMKTVIDNAKRGHDNEDEFFADYRKNPDRISYDRWYLDRAGFSISTYPESIDAHGPSVAVQIEAQEWPQILAVMDVFEENKQQSLLPEPDSNDEEDEDEPTIFIGHGPTAVWKELRDHLRDKHDFTIEAYEIGARAGHSVRDILERMLEESTMAFLVMTGDDKTTTGEMHPRLNVVHEAGLFQGRLGFHRAIILLEEGVTEFSNIHGVEQIRFKNIKEIFGDVVATVRREFPSA